MTGILIILLNIPACNVRSVWNVHLIWKRARPDQAASVTAGRSRPLGPSDSWSVW